MIFICITVCNVHCLFTWTGFFTAPVRGAYHFELYVGSASPNYHSSGVYLVKNEENVVLAYERGPNGHSSAANGATLLLEPGDVVFPRLFHTTNIFDDGNHHSSFSGHLLFPL
uniref:C1q domain-containing protein n=1 Tax=Neogobius melanostomus TaxID=47308 RepID=A0A8C6SCQ8_9GOBI